jgi:excisionase family DNA binding protein
MSAPATDPLATFLAMVRAAAREGAQEALAAQGVTAPATSPPLIDKRGVAHALGVSPATIDRLCRSGRMPFVVVGEVRRFDLVAVRAALAESHGSQAASPPPMSAPTQTPIAGVRLLSRRSR